MNYRRGFQRLYALLTVVWIVGVLFVTVPSRPEVPNYDALAEQVRREVPPPPLGAIPIQPQNKPATFEHIDWPATERAQSIQKWEWAAGLSLGPPLTGYLIFFLVGPWIYRGFKSV